MRWVLLFVVLTVPASAIARCFGINRCGCDQRPNWAAVFRWEAASDGGTLAVVESVSTVSGQDSGPDPSGWDSYQAAGSRMIVTEQGERLPIDSDGGIRCETVTFVASTWPAALTDRSCVQLLDDARVVQPPCNDRGSPGCGCSAAGALFPGAVLLLMLGRRRT